MAPLLTLAWLAELWERAWPRFWPFTLAAGTVLALALYGVFAWLPAALHALTLVAAALLLLALAHRCAHSVPWPGLADARRRIERSSGLPHRPLAALADRPASFAPEDGEGDGEGLAVWRLHQERMRRALGRLRVGMPRAGLGERDPWGLRAVLAFALLLAPFVGSDPAGRLLSSFTPGAAGPGPRAAEVALWITPPDYAHIAPLYLSSADAPRNTAPLAVLAGSKVLAHVTGGAAVPELAVGETRTPFEALDKASYRLEGVIAGGDRLVVSQGGRILLERPLDVTADRPPEVAFAAPPSATRRQALRLDFAAKDDFGVERVTARIARQGDKTEDKTEDRGGETLALDVALDLPLSAPGAKTATGTGYRDFTAHPWAGLPVTVRLEATDGAGQSGTSDGVALVLPERPFRHPVARAIIEQRKRLVREPSARDEVAAAVGAIAAEPGQYNNDSVVTLTLSSARARLLKERTPESTRTVLKLLWDAAVRIEDGDVGSAEQQLREAREALQDALAKGETDPETIERLMNELQTALDNYLEALARSAGAERGERRAESGPAREIRPDELKALMERIQNLSRTGQREAAAELLAQLQDILENLRTPTRRADSQMQRFADQALRELDDLGRRQRELMEESFQGAEPPSGQEFGTPPSTQPGMPRPGGADAGLAGQQEKLRRDLGEFMRGLGEGLGTVPDPLGAPLSTAEQAMRGASRALAEENRTGAQERQGEALEQLGKGAAELRRELDRRLAEEGGLRGGGAEDRDFGTDPRGPFAGTGDGVEIPDEAEVQRAWQILQELRRRAGDPQRPSVERDYLDRLLEPF